MKDPLTNWIPRSRPGREVREGRYCRLEPLDTAGHGDQLFAASMAPGAEERFRYLPDSPQGRDDFTAWLSAAAMSDDPLFFAVIDRATQNCGGRQALMRMVPEHGVIEIGHILWGPGVAQTRIASEALYLSARWVFEELGYRRFEWKCNARNEPSRRAALRFGFNFEGIFRQHLIIKGQNRDTAWFSMLDCEWPARKAAFEEWLAPDNFDAEGRQKNPLRRN